MRRSTTGKLGRPSAYSMALSRGTHECGMPSRMSPNSLSNSEKEEFPSVKGPFNKKWFSSEDPQWLRGNMNDDTYAVTHEGEVFTYDLNRDSAAKLRSVKERIYSAFDAMFPAPEA